MSKDQPGYSERDDKPTAEPTGGDPEVLEERERHGADGEPSDADAQPSGGDAGEDGGDGEDGGTT